MSSNDYNYEAPNLATILASLASLANQNQAAQPQTYQYQTQPQPQPQPHPQPYPQHQPQHQPQPPRSRTPPLAPAQDDQYHRVWQEQLNSASQAGHSAIHPAPPAKKIIEPCSIVDWQAGLRCVAKTVAAHESIIKEIRRMIKTQHENEEQWFKGREGLIEKQKARAENQNKLDEVLKAVGGAISSTSTTNTAEELARELQTFDMKVYRAQLTMNKEMTARLKSFGVPFFGTKPELIRPRAEAGEGAPRDKEDKGVIDEVELVQLQRKMLSYLEDLCGGEP